MSIADRLVSAFKNFAGQVAISSTGSEVTYGQLQQDVFKVAAYLKQQGLINACIAVDIDDAVSHITATLGIVISGNYYVSVTAENRSFFASANLPIAFTLSNQSYAQVTAGFDKLLKSNATGIDSDQLWPEISDDMNMCAFFTSGSTGKSKVIIHQHKNILTDTLRQINHNGITHVDKLDLVFSLSFSASLACIYPALMTGAQICIFDLKTEGLTKLAYFWQQRDITFSTLSVTSFHGICKIHPSLHHLHALRFVCISAEPVKDATIRLFQTTFGTNTTLQIAYAATETRTISEMKVINDGLPLKYPDSIGKPVADKKLIINDDNGNALPSGSVGEIVVCSKYIANAYYGQPVESKQSFIIHNEEVYYKTGDMGYLNDEGYLFYQGRLKNEQKLNGIKINLQDIEDEVEKLKPILQAAVVINRCEADSPKLSCFFVLAESVNLDVQEIRQFIAASLPSTHLPKFYIALPELPLTHSGKKDRKKLELFDIKAHLDKQLKPVRAADNQYEEMLISIFKDILKVSNIGTDTDFYDAGGDSMSSLLCVAEIESQFRVSISVTTLAANASPKKLSTYLKQRNTNNLLFEKIVLNSYDANRQTLYLLNNGRNSYGPLINTTLASKFNLIELVFDMYGHNNNADYAGLVLTQLANEIGAHKESLVLGMSFSGFMAHQLACLLPQISYCILLDTYDYFEYEKYLQKTATRKAVIASLFWHVFKNGDWGYPIYFIQWRKNRKINKKNKIKNDIGRDGKSNKIFIEKINYFVSSLQHQTTFNNCIYFQATRHKKDIGRSWGLRIGRRFYYKGMFCAHSEIIKDKSEHMARFIIKKVQADKGTGINDRLFFRAGRRHKEVVKSY